MFQTAISTLGPVRRPGRSNGCVELGDRSLLALSTLLGDKAYLMGDAPCGVDATAFGASPVHDTVLRLGAPAEGGDLL